MMTPEEIEQRFKRIEAKLDRIEEARRSEERKGRVESKAWHRRFNHKMESMVRALGKDLTGRARDRFVKRWEKSLGRPIDWTLTPKEERARAESKARWKRIDRNLKSVDRNMKSTLRKLATMKLKRSRKSC